MALRVSRRFVFFASIAVLFGAVIWLAVVLWPRTESARRREALTSATHQEVFDAALALAEAPDPESLPRLEETQERLIAEIKRQVREAHTATRHLDFHQLLRRTTDLRSLPDHQRLWAALGAVNFAIASTRGLSPEPGGPEPGGAETGGAETGGAEAR